MSRRAVIAAFVAATALTVAGCSEESSSEPSGTTVEETTTTEESTQESETGASPAGEVEYTAPGAELKIGDKAVVPYKSGTEQGALGITVTAVEKGTAADIAELREDTKGAVPYFVRYTVTNESGNDFSYVSSVAISGILSDGTSSGGIIGGNGVAKCEQGEAGDDFVTAGATFEGCQIALSPEAYPVAGAEYDDDASRIVPDHDYGDSPIIWK